ncbi:subtilisin-like protein [Cadophora sp. DSE1049]|nr:subtilisin-like protein [Cadophora sp. DSE1049]
MSPTPMVILMKESASEAQYKDLVLSVPDAPNHVEIIYEQVNFRVLVANVNDCDIRKLWDNPIVETMSREGPYILDDEADDIGPVIGKREAVTTPDEDFRLVVRDESNATAGLLSGRALDPLIDLRTQANSPWHLKLLSGLSHQVGTALNGLFYDFPGYLYADRLTTGPSVSEINIYLLDTGIRASHNDFAGRAVTALDATAHPIGLNPGDSSAGGHGTHMCSVSAGNYAGVAKNANIVSVKKNQDVSVLSRAIGLILRDVVRDEYQGRAVINMSFGAFVQSLYPNDLPQGAPGPQMDIVGAFLGRLYRAGIVVVCSAGNRGSSAPLNDLTPRLHGGRNTPLIVVGNSRDDESRYHGSQCLDPNNDGILTIYANGVDVVSASNRDDDLYRTATGTSEATAVTSGLIAYLIANDVLQAQLIQGGLGNFAAAVKAHIIQLGISMKGIARVDPSLNTPDNIPRLANGEAIECLTQNGQVSQALYQLPPEEQQILPGNFPRILVTKGLEVLVPQNQLPPCVRRP